MGSDLVILRIESLLCIAASLCAIWFVILRRGSLVAACGAIVAALSLMMVAHVVVAAVLAARERPMLTAQAAPPRTAATASPVVTPAATGTPAAAARTEAVRNFRTSWTTIVQVSVAAIRAHDTAGEYLRRRDDVAAKDELKKCEATATAIVGDSAGLALDAKNASDLELLTVIKKIGDGLTYGCKSARSYLDTNAPADYADTNAHFSGVADAIVRSQTLARAKYQSLGGDPDSLLSFKTALR